MLWQAYPLKNKILKERLLTQILTVDLTECIVFWKEMLIIELHSGVVAGTLVSQHENLGSFMQRLFSGHSSFLLQTKSMLHRLIDDSVIPRCECV